MNTHRISCGALAVFVPVPSTISLHIFLPIFGHLLEFVGHRLEVVRLASTNHHSAGVIPLNSRGNTSRVNGIESNELAFFPHFLQTPRDSMVIIVQMQTENARALLLLPSLLLSQ